MQSRPKDTSKKLAAVLKAWEDLRKGRSFAGMTLAQFKAKVQPSLDERATIDSVNVQLIATTDRRNDADKETRKQIALVVNVIKGDPAEGEDGELYEAMGYVRKSARKSGLTNKSKAAATTS